ncbi:MAG: ABC transporter ATP-binding protein [Candidatus Omnitrophica bacterium]|nr:ABC transporter ATP-binding protein [Candidatus Omnitrophota bacterium]
MYLLSIIYYITLYVEIFDLTVKGFSVKLLTMPPLIEVHNLSKYFFTPISFKRILKLDFKHKEPTCALQDINFSVSGGNTLGILGLNGAGKTTLLKIIATLILPDKGKIQVAGYLVGRDDEKIKSLVGLVSSSERSFYWRLSGRQNLEFFSSLYGLNKKQTKSRIDELMDLFGVDYQDRRFGEYSTGMQKKFVLMRALIHNPQILLLDEPTKSLDYATALRLRDFIKEKIIKQQGKTVIFATHNLDEALDFADSFMILHKGKLLALGTLQELRRVVAKPQATLGEIFLRITQQEQYYA